MVFRPRRGLDSLQRRSLGGIPPPGVFTGMPPAAFTRCFFGWYSAPRRGLDLLQRQSLGAIPPPGVRWTASSSSHVFFWIAPSGNHWVVYRPPACFPVGRHFWSSVTEAAPEGCRRMTTINFYPPKKQVEFKSMPLPQEHVIAGGHIGVPCCAGSVA